MRFQIALLTPGLSGGEAAAVAAFLRERFGPEVGIEQLDALTGQGRSEAAQALASGRFAVVLSSVARIDPMCCRTPRRP